MGKDTEHQEFAYGSQDAAVNDAHWRKQEASYDKADADDKVETEDFHGLTKFSLSELKRELKLSSELRRNLEGKKSFTEKKHPIKFRLNSDEKKKD